MGIPAKDLPYIFDLFAQADRSLDRAQGGLGVGLTLVERIGELHGGSVAANSEGVGHGTEFIIRLPSADGAATEARSVTEAKAETIGGCCRVLVVDDSIDSAEMMKLLLRLDGHEVEMTHDGLSAIEIARWFRPHVVLLDIGLPGMNGYETARAMKEEIDVKPWVISPVRDAHGFTKLATEPMHQNMQASGQSRSGQHAADYDGRPQSRA
jgi:CheY-like chemotaxis protein